MLISWVEVKFKFWVHKFHFVDWNVLYVFMYFNLQIFSTNNLFSLVWEPSTKSRKELFKESINLVEEKKKIRMTLSMATLIMIYVAESLREQKNVWKILFVTIKAMVFSSSLVWLWELDHKEDWAPKNWCFHTVVLVKTLESPLDSKEIKPGYPKGNQPWIVIGRTDAEAEAPILWPPDLKRWLIGKNSDAGKDWRQEERTGWNG